ncbi:uncharacterized protein LOC134846020 isoform X2 [Symsagittifera roscoffensis]
MSILHDSNHFLRQSQSDIWILPFMAPIFTYLALPMLLLNSLSQIKNPMFYLQFQKNLMRFATLFVWLLGSGWCAILVACYLADLDGKRPFSQFMVVIHSLSVAFCVFIVFDMTFHKWKGRRRVHHQSQPLCYHCVTSRPATPSSANQRPLMLVSSICTNSATNQLSTIESNSFPLDPIIGQVDLIPDFILLITSSVLLTLPINFMILCSQNGYRMNPLTNVTLTFLYLNPLCSIVGVILYTALKFDTLTNFAN